MPGTSGSTKKALVFGGAGMLGRVVVAALGAQGFAVDSRDRSTFDILGPWDELAGLVAASDVVVNCAAIVPARGGQFTDLQMFRVNADFPQALGEHAVGAGIPLIHMSTEGVFGPDQGDCFESTAPRPVDIYGRSKLDGEPPYALNIRTSIIGEDRRNRRGLLEWARTHRGSAIQGFSNHLWNGLTCLEAATRMTKLATGLCMRNDRGAGLPRLHHWHTRPAISKEMVLRAIDEAYGLGLEIEAVRAPAGCVRLVRPRIEDDLNTCVLPYSAQLAALRSFHERFEG